MADLLNLDAAAAYLHISPKTLRGYMVTGDLKHIAFGHGLLRKRRMFHPDDLEDFLARKRRADACPPTAQKTGKGPSPRPSTTTTSGSNVVGFMARRAAERSAKQTERNSGRG